jgi:hypothetical protein
MAQGTGSSEEVEFSIQISLDGGKTFVCLGQSDCTAVTIPVGGHSLPEAPTPMVALPSDQRVRDAVLRQVIRNISGQMARTAAMHSGVDAHLPCHSVVPV